MPTHVVIQAEDNRYDRNWESWQLSVFTLNAELLLDNVTFDQTNRLGCWSSW